MMADVRVSNKTLMDEALFEVQSDHLEEMRASREKFDEAIMEYKSSDKL
jgi:hypothetical protein